MFVRRASALLATAAVLLPVGLTGCAGTSEARCGSGESTPMAAALQFIDGLRIDKESTICAALASDSGWDRNGADEKAAIAKVAAASETTPGIVAQVSQSAIDDPIAFFSGATGEIILVVATENVDGKYVVDWAGTRRATADPAPVVRSLNIGTPHDV